MVKKALISGVTFLAGGLLLLLIQYGLGASADHTKFVSMTQVFEKSKLKDKYEQELKQLEMLSNAKLAQQEQELKAFRVQNGNTPEAAQLEKSLLDARDAMSADFQQKSETFQAVVWKEINAKIEKYGKMHELDFILGAKGDGTIMYASDAQDVTEEIIAYINQ
jgi:Skp family chaperone for outer membrane proteins